MRWKVWKWLTQCKSWAVGGRFCLAFCMLFWSRTRVYFLPLSSDPFLKLYSCIDFLFLKSICSSNLLICCLLFNRCLFFAPLSDFTLRHFWNWTYFSSYVQFMCLFVCVTGALTFTFLEFTVFVEILGFLALTTEAMLGVPQFLQNLKNHSTKGMRLV